VNFLSMYRGDDRIVTITSSEALTGSVVTFTARARPGGPVLITKTNVDDGGLTIGDPATTAAIAIDAADTVDLEPSVLRWDVQVVDDEDKTHTVASGFLVLRADISAPAAAAS
jgi:hypothetical protein